MRILSWCRSNAMLAAAVLAAGVTAFFVPPDGEYLGYFDMKTLCCLFCVLRQREKRLHGARYHNDGGFHAAHKRHGAADLSAARLVRA